MRREPVLIEGVLILDSISVLKSVLVRSGGSVDTSDSMVQREERLLQTTISMYGGSSRNSDGLSRMYTWI